MAESVYEGMFILDAGRYGRDPEGVAGQIPKMIQEAAGQMLVSRLWEERRLAFPIRGQRKGAYWLAYFRLEGTKLPEIRRKCQLSDSILRSLVLKVDPRIVDALVDHAKAGPGAAPKPGEPPKPGAAAKPGEPAPEKRGETAKQTATAVQNDSDSNSSGDNKG